MTLIWKTLSHRNWIRATEPQTLRTAAYSVMINACLTGNYSTVSHYTSVGLVWKTKPGLTMRYSAFSICHSPSLYFSFSLCICVQYMEWNNCIQYYCTDYSLKIVCKLVCCMPLFLLLNRDNIYILKIKVYCIVSCIYFYFFTFHSSSISFALTYIQICCIKMHCTTSDARYHRFLLGMHIKIQADNNKISS